MNSDFIFLNMFFLNLSLSLPISESFLNMRKEMMKSEHLRNMNIIM